MSHVPTPTVKCSWPITCTVQSGYSVLTLSFWRKFNWSTTFKVGKRFDETISKISYALYYRSRVEKNTSWNRFIFCFNERITTLKKKIKCISNKFYLSTTTNLHISFFNLFVLSNNGILFLSGFLHFRIWCSVSWTL